MPESASMGLARALAPRLAGLTWAIGGSTLLCRLGLVDEPRDLDLVVPVADFDQIVRRLSVPLGPGVRPASPDHRSECFARFQPNGPVSVDVMAGIAVRVDDGVQRWHFDPSRIEQHSGLPWMKAEDWLVLYRLFNRPSRVALLEQHLRRGAEGVQG